MPTPSDHASFHDVVLGNGALPLEILEELDDEWIARPVKY